MFTTNTVTIKQGRNGNEYKSLKGTYNGEEIIINMWNDNPEYDNVIEGYSFQCSISKNGEYYNFDIAGRTPKPTVKPVQDQLTSAKLEAIWTGVKEIGRHLKIPYFEQGSGSGHTDEQLEILKDVKPEDIPF